MTLTLTPLVKTNNKLNHLLKKYDQIKTKKNWKTNMIFLDKNNDQKSNLTKERRVREHLKHIKKLFVVIEIVKPTYIYALL